MPLTDDVSLATPSSVLVYDGPPATDAWHLTRLTGITATDLPKILGQSSYGNAMSVWARKRGELDEDEAGEAATWGNLLEGPVADEWARRRGTKVRNIGIIARHDALWQLASLDRLVMPCPDGDGPCALEVKTRSAFVAGDWHHEVPDDVLAQVQWQLHVSGYGHEHVAALIGGQKLREFRVDRDEAVIRLLVSEATRVWECVQSGEPPAVTPDAVHRRVLDALHPNRDGIAYAPAAQVQALLAERADVLHNLAGLNKIVKEAKGELEAVDAELIGLLGDAEALAIEGQDEPVLTYREVARSGYTVAPTTYRTIRIPKQRSTT
jgi:putative phage-type endonuclease